MAPMPPVPPGEYNSPTVRAHARLALAQRRAAQRAAWWFPLAVVGCALACLWGVLRSDQYLADQLFWPASGAQFVEVGPVPADADSTGGPISVVAGGLNRKSGTGPALALLPSLTADGGRVFSLVYGSGINDRDIQDKFDALIDKVRPDRVDFFGSSMGGDVVLDLAQHLQQSRANYRHTLQTEPAPDIRPIPAQVGVGDPDRSARPSAFATIIAAPPARTSTAADQAVPPRLGVIYLDCTPLSASDVRDTGRTKADALTAVSEALHTDGGVGVRLTAEVLAQQQQWSTGAFPFLEIRWDDLAFKIRQVWRDKIDGPGVSTELIKDQFGVIRRMDIDAVAHDLGAGTRIVFFRPVVSSDDRVVRVAAAESTLRRLATEDGLDLRIAPIPDGHHASAESNTQAYLAVLDSTRTTRGS